MTLVSDLVQALLIPLVAWDLHVFGTTVTLPVTPLALVLTAGLLDRGLRLLRRPRRRAEDASPGAEELPAWLATPES